MEDIEPVPNRQHRQQQLVKKQPRCPRPARPRDHSVCERVVAKGLEVLAIDEQDEPFATSDHGKRIDQRVKVAVDSGRFRQQRGQVDADPQRNRANTTLDRHRLLAGEPRRRLKGISRV